MPTIVTFLILAALWLAVLAPRMLRRLSQYQTERKYWSDTPLLSGLSRYTNVVPLTNVTQLSPPARPALVTPGVGVDREGLARLQREQARARRRKILVCLLVLAVATLVASVGVGGVMIGVHLAVDILLVGYVGALATRQRRVLERHAKVTDISSARGAVYAANRSVQSPAQEAAVSFIGGSRGWR